MSHVVYMIVEHDGGFAYRVGGTISETFASRALAHKAAEAASVEQRAPGQTSSIEYETADGKWHEERSPGGERPQTEVKD